MTLAMAAAAVMVLVILVDVHRHGNNPLNLVQPGAQGPSRGVISRDFPKVTLPEGVGFDGQMFYAIARQPMHLDRVVTDLDRPRYRLQRPLLSWLAWGLQPSGGGTGLIGSIFVVEVLALVAGGVAAGVISVTLGGKTWPAACFALLPGSYVCLRTGVADALGLALALTVVAVALRRRWVAAVVLAALTVLAKEVAVLVLVGFALWRRSRLAALVVATPVLTALVWALGLRLLLPHGGGRVDELVLPFTGLIRSIGRWSQHRELDGAAAVTVAVALAIVALLRRGVRSPFGAAIVLQLAFLTVCGVEVLSNNLSGPRATMTLAMTSILALAVPANGAEAVERVGPRSHVRMVGSSADAAAGHGPRPASTSLVRTPGPSSAAREVDDVASRRGQRDGELRACRRITA